MIVHRWLPHVVLETETSQLTKKESHHKFVTSECLMDLEALLQGVDEDCVKALPAAVFIVLQGDTLDP